MSKLLRRGLDAYENRRQRSDEEFAERLSHHVDALSDRPTLLIYLLTVGAVNALIWVSVLLAPTHVMRAWAVVNDLDDKIGASVIAIIFGLGMWLTYSLFRLKFPDLADPKFDDEFLASFHRSVHSTKRWRIWLVSVIGGILNVLLLVAMEIFLAVGL